MTTPISSPTAGRPLSMFESIVNVKTVKYSVIHRCGASDVTKVRHCRAEILIREYGKCE